MVSHARLRHRGHDRRIATLSPLAVAPDHQRLGIGSELVRAVTARAEALGEPLVVLEGSPAYYRRFGFEPASPLGIVIDLPDWAPPEAAQVLRLSAYTPEIRGHLVFDALADAEAEHPVVDVPGVVARLAGGSACRCVWTNQLGGLTFEIPDRRLFVKWAPAAHASTLQREADRLRWAAPHTAVPEVVELAAGDDGSAALVTRALPGRSAVDDRWKATPDVAVRAIGTGLRALHDALPVEACPFSWAPGDRLLAGTRLDRTAWHPCHRHLAVDEALARVAEPPPIDRLVVCHGDACAPNTLVGDDGRCTGHVDLADLGVADRWADLAIATWSTEWNYGPGWEDELLAAYGIDRDDERTRYYRLLWDLTG